MEQQFRKALVELCRENTKLLGRPPRRLLQMIDERGPIEAVQCLLDADHPSETFADLWPAHQESTVEALALRPEWASFFSEAQLATARKRLGR
jgi:hypothetical protein